jgi:hypothetical protein
MPWKIYSACDGRFVVIRASGAVSFVDLLNRTGGGDGCFSVRGAERILMDFLDAAAETADLDLYHLPIFYDELHLDRNCRIALTLPGSHVKYGLYQSYVEVSRDRGVNLGLFSSNAQSLEWLGWKRHNRKPAPGLPALLVSLRSGLYAR